MNYVKFIAECAGACLCLVAAHLASADDFSIAEEGVFHVLNEVERQIPRETFDAAVIIEGQPKVGFHGVGSDPKKIFEWVRGNTCLVPYRGVLRAHQGVLMDRVGNSLDRALLLLHLLQQAGHKNVRLAYADLPDSDANAMLTDLCRASRGAQKEVHASVRSADDFTVQLNKCARRYKLDSAELRESIEQLNRNGERIAEQAKNRVRDQSQMLLNLLDESGLLPEATQQRMKRQARDREALRHHWWVQVKSSSGESGGRDFVDLDPSLPDSEYGKAFAEPQQIVLTDELDDKLRDERHVVEIRIVIERWENGKLVEVPVIEQEFLPAALIGKHLTIHHAPTDWDTNPPLFADGKLIDHLRKMSTKRSKWIPILSLGNQYSAMHGFNTQGKIFKNTFLPFASPLPTDQELARGLSDGIEEIGDKFERLLRREKLVGNHDDGSQLTAEWIDYEIRRPGETSETIRRQVFDLIGPAKRQLTKENADQLPRKLEFDQRQCLRRTLALLGQTEILLMPAQFSSHYLEYSKAQNLLENRNVIRLLLEGFDPGGKVSMIEATSEIRPFPAQLHDLAYSRREWSPHPQDMYLDRVNVLSFHRYLQVNSKSKLVVENAFDIVANHVAVRRDRIIDHARMRFAQGVLDTNAEALLLQEWDSLSAENASELLRMSSDSNTDWVVFKNGGQLDQHRNGLSPDARTRIDRQMRNQHVVIAPSSSIEFQGKKTFAWWRVNLATGNVLGYGKHGWGQATTCEPPRNYIAWSRLTVRRGAFMLRQEPVCFVGDTLGFSHPSAILQRPESPAEMALAFVFHRLNGLYKKAIRLEQD